MERVRELLEVVLAKYGLMLLLLLEVLVIVLVFLLLCRPGGGIWKLGRQEEVLGHHQVGGSEDQHEAGDKEEQYRGWVLA